MVWQLAYQRLQGSSGADVGLVISEPELVLLSFMMVAICMLSQIYGVQVNDSPSFTKLLSAVPSQQAHDFSTHQRRKALNVARIALQVRNLPGRVLCTLLHVLGQQ